MTLSKTPLLITALFALLILFSACKKNGSKSTKGNFHNDITVFESVGGAEQPQNLLGFYSSSSDPTTLLAVASRGMDETSARGFRFITIQNETVSSVKSFQADAAYTYQMATCAAMDNNENCWIGGHVFGGNNSFGKPFLVKLSKTGSIISSKFYNVLDNSSNPISFRAIGIKALLNGDILFLTHSLSGLQIYRVGNNGTTVWAKLIPSVSGFVFENPFQKFNVISNPVNQITETSDGSIFIVNNLNSVQDCVIKLGADGSMIFAKTYKVSSPFTAGPSQIIALSSDRLILAGQRNAAVTGLPYLYSLSENGIVFQAKGLPDNQSISNPFQLNQVQYVNNSIYVSTTGGYEFSTYRLNQELSLQQSHKTLSTNIITTDRGGLSVYSSSKSAFYHLLDISGQPGEGNGFQLIKTQEDGASCESYAYRPEPFSIGTLNPTVTDITSSLQLLPAFTNNTSNLDWQPSSVPIAEQYKACEN
jgi:hypothetical protein